MRGFIGFILIFIGSFLVGYSLTNLVRGLDTEDKQEVVCESNTTHSN